MPWSPIPSRTGSAPSSSALIVCGDICEPPPPEPAGEPAPTEADEPEDIRSNGLLASWPVDCADDDFDDVSALRSIDGR